MANNKLGRPTKERIALIKSQATALLWYGRIETTLQRAKSVQPYVEKILNLAIRNYDNTVDVSIEKKHKNQERSINHKDGINKLNARRKIMSMLYDVSNKAPGPDASESEIEKFEEDSRAINHPLIEKIFNDYASTYANMEGRKDCHGGYTRIIKIGKRRGDNADMAIIELVDLDIIKSKQK